MSEHYFTAKPKSSSLEKSYQTTIQHTAQNNTPHKKNNICSIQTISVTFTTSASIFSGSRLDPGTRLLIEHAYIPEISGEDSVMSILDLGCGYGPVGISIKKLYPKTRVILCDMNERAVKYAQKNALANNVKIDVYVSDLFKYPALQQELFDVILVNPPFSAGKKICMEFISQSYVHLKRGGTLQLVAPHNKGGSSLEKYMVELFGNVETLAKHAGFRVYMSVKKE